MNENTNTVDQDANQTLDTDLVSETPDELATLKARARSLGLNFSNNIGLDSLRQRVNDHIASGLAAPSSTPSTPVILDGSEIVTNTVAPRPLTKVEREIQIRREQRAEQLKLVRVRIVNMNPAKRDLHGEIFAVANRFLGIVKKYVPYGEATDNGYHLPYVIYKQLKDRKFLQIKTRKATNNPGQIVVDQRWVPEFNIELLDPLTPQELASLANQQAAAKGLDG